MGKIKFKKVCPYCNHNKPDYDYFHDLNGEYSKICKQCYTQDFNEENEDYFKWVIEDLDFPYVRVLWEQSKNLHKNTKGQNKIIYTIDSYIALINLGRKER